MSQINVNRIKDSNKGAPDFPSGVNVGGITSTVTLGVTNLNPTNVNVSGVVTATTLDGNLLATGTPTLGLGVTINTSGINISGVATAGIVSATTLYGDGTNITGIALSIAPLNYNPAVGGLAVGSGTGIGITFNQGVKAGSGNVTLRIAGAAGTVVENFGVGNSVTYGDSDYGTTVSITPTSSLSSKETYHLSYPSGAFTNIGGDVSYVGTAYTFITVGGQIWMWGRNEFGVLDNNLADDAHRSSPVQVPGNGWSSKMATTDGEGLSAAIKENGELWLWGGNLNGPLGQNQAHPAIRAVSSPVQVPGTTWAQVTVGWNFPAGNNILAVKTDNTLWAWGSNSRGQLGLNDRTNYSSPVQIPGTTWKQATSGGQQGVCAVKTDGTLWSWGFNESGALGLDNTTDYSSPVQVPGTTWEVVSSGSYCTFAVKTDNTLWAWGGNSTGVLGQNNKTNYSSPKQIPGSWGTTTRHINAGNGNFAFMINTSGELFGTGRQLGGNLAQNTSNVYYSSPVQIPGTTWKSVTASAWKGFATKTDGTLWAWGNNSAYGALGQNNLTNYSSPVQVPGTDWNIVATNAEGYWIMAHKEV